MFKISISGTLTSLYSFTGANDGADPNGLVEGSDGNFYGTTSSGGTNGGFGTVFKISTKGALTSLYSFAGGNGGAAPVARLVQGTDGNFYGATSSGGEGPGFIGYGTVFKINTNGALTSLYSFGTVTNANGLPLDGADPTAGLVQGTDGNFYGTTIGGGTDGYGYVFRISTNGGLISLYSFTGTNDGENPNSGLVLGSDGSFYGTTTALRFMLASSPHIMEACSISAPMEC